MYNEDIRCYHNVSIYFSCEKCDKENVEKKINIFKWIIYKLCGLKYLEDD